MSTIVGSNIITDGLVFALDGISPLSGTGTDFQNIVDTSYQATTVTGTTRDTDGIYFNAVNNKIVFPYNSTFDLLTFSIEVVFKSTDLAQDNFATLFSKEEAGFSFSNYAMAADTTGTYLRFGYWSDVLAGNAEIDASAYNDLEDGLDIWHHYIGTYDGSNLNLYRNGILVDTLPSTNTPRINTNGIGVGNRPVNQVYYFNGHMGFVRLYNKGLTTTEVEQNWKSANKRFNII